MFKTDVITVIKIGATLRDGLHRKPRRKLQNAIIMGRHNNCNHVFGVTTALLLDQVRSWKQQLTYCLVISDPRIIRIRKNTALNNIVSVVGQNVKCEYRMMEI